MLLQRVEELTDLSIDALQCATLMDLFACESRFALFPVGVDAFAVVFGGVGERTREGNDLWNEMAEAIKRLIDHPDAANRLAENGHFLASKLDWKSIAAEYIEIYDSF